MKRKAIGTLALAAAATAMLVTGMPLLASETNAGIGPSFRQTYVYRTYLKDDAVTAETKDGLVMLTGTVAEESHKALAQEVVASLLGVTYVENHIEVRGEIPAVNSDAWGRARVQSMLAFHRGVSDDGTEVDFKNGTVTLRGNTTSNARRNMTTHYAKSVEGVTEVRNEMTVVIPPENPIEPPAEQIDDASITAQAKLTLAYHSATGALANEVRTKDGVVVLIGKARDIAAQDLVALLLIDVHGVKSVVDTHNGVSAYCKGPVPTQPNPNALLAEKSGLLSSPARLAGGDPVGGAFPTPHK